MLETLDYIVIAAFIVLVSIPALVTWAKPDIKKSVLGIAMVFSTIFLVLCIGLDAIKSQVTPFIVIKGIVGSLLGLLLGVVWQTRRKAGGPE